MKKRFVLTGIIGKAMVVAALALGMALAGCGNKDSGDPTGGGGLFTISGTILDSDNGYILSEADVELEKWERLENGQVINFVVQSVKSDARGNYAFTGVPVGTYYRINARITLGLYGIVLPSGVPGTTYYSGSTDPFDVTGNLPGLNVTLQKMSL